MGTVVAGEQDKTLHFLKCELADTNRMYAAADFGDDDLKGNGLAFAALREHGFEIAIHCVFGEDDGLPPTMCIDINGVSAIRQHDFFWWLTDLLEPFGGHVEEAGYVIRRDRTPSGRRTTDQDPRPVGMSRINPENLTAACARGCDSAVAASI